MRGIRRDWRVLVVGREVRFEGEEGKWEQGDVGLNC